MFKIVSTALLAAYAQAGSLLADSDLTPVSVEDNGTYCNTATTCPCWGSSPVCCCSSFNQCETSSTMCDGNGETQATQPEEEVAAEVEGLEGTSCHTASTCPCYGGPGYCCCSSFNQCETSSYMCEGNGDSLYDIIFQ